MEEMAATVGCRAAMVNLVAMEGATAADVEGALAGGREVGGVEVGAPEAGGTAVEALAGGSAGAVVVSYTHPARGLSSRRTGCFAQRRSRRCTT